MPGGASRLQPRLHQTHARRSPTHLGEDGLGLGDAAPGRNLRGHKGVSDGDHRAPRQHDAQVDGQRVGGERHVQGHGIACTHGSRGRRVTSWLCTGSVSASSPSCRLASRRGGGKGREQRTWAEAGGAQGCRHVRGAEPQLGQGPGVQGGGGALLCPHHRGAVWVPPAERALPDVEPRPGEPAAGVSLRPHLQNPEQGKGRGLQGFWGCEKQNPEAGPRFWSSGRPACRPAGRPQGFPQGSPAPGGRGVESDLQPLQHRGPEAFRLRERQALQQRPVGRRVAGPPPLPALRRNGGGTSVPGSAGLHAAVVGYTPTRGPSKVRCRLPGSLA